MHRKCIDLVLAFMKFILSGCYAYTGCDGASLILEDHLLQSLRGFAWRLS